MVRVVSGGKLLGFQKTEVIVPVDLEPAQGKAYTPGSIDGNVGLGLLVAEAARLEHGVPSVSYVEFMFKEYAAVVYALIKPVVATVAATVTAAVDSQGNPGPAPSRKKYPLRLLKNAPRLRGLLKEFTDAGIPLREDQWYTCQAELVKDAEEGFVVALDWTHAKIEPRDIIKERKQAAEARKRRKEQKKLEAEGGATNRGPEVKKAPPEDPSEPSGSVGA